MKQFLGLVLSGLSSFAFSNPSSGSLPWVEVPIPGAVCGRGEPYMVYLKYRSPEKMMIGFQGGGACWNKLTCSKLSPLAKLNPARGVDPFGAIFAPDLRSTYMADASFIYFPYCTGDVFTGSHNADYGRFSIRHEGATNVRKSMDYLREQNFIDFDQVSKLVQYGSSAGAVGAIAHIRLMEEYFSNATEKTLLADSPGLHWGKDFFEKFKGDYKTDLIGSLENVGVEIDPNSGNVAQHVDTLCNNNPTWRIGFLQSTKDIVMSVVFGEINPWRHRDIVLGSKGIFETVRTKTQNCSVYLNDGFAHMFFDKKNLMTKLVEGLSPQNFVLKILSGSNRVFLPSEVRPSSSRRDRGFASQTRDDQDGLLDPSNPR
jgi:hypothetical protein